MMGRFQGVCAPALALCSWFLALRVSDLLLSPTCVYCVACRAVVADRGTDSGIQRACPSDAVGSMIASRVWTRDCFEESNAYCFQAYEYSVQEHCLVILIELF